MFSSSSKGGSGDRSLPQRSRPTNDNNPNVEQLKEARRLSDRLEYERRKLAGECTKCGDPVVEGQQLCSRHLEYQRKHAATSIQKLRSNRRKKKQCARCGLRSERYTCDGCLLAQGRPTWRRVLLHSNQSVKPERAVQGFVEAVEADGTYTEGRKRVRYRGRASRGRASQAQEVDELFALAIASLQAARSRAQEAYAEHAGGHLDKREYRALVLSWIGQKDLAERFSEEIDDKVSRAKLERG